jgi:YD repeat-containing protein
MTTYHRITTDRDGMHRVMRVTRDAAGDLIASVLVAAYRSWDRAHATAVRLDGGAA